MNYHPLFSDSDDDTRRTTYRNSVKLQGATDVFVPDRCVDTSSLSRRGHSRRTLASIFAEDSLVAEHGKEPLHIEALRHSSDYSCAPDTSVTTTATSSHLVSKNPLHIARHASVQTFRGETYVGTCVIALCVPRARQVDDQMTAMVVIINRQRQTVCRAQLDRRLQLTLNPSDLQYLCLFDSAFGIYWSMMFPGRRDALCFLSSAFSIVHCSQVGRADDSTGTMMEFGSSRASEESDAGALARPGMTCYFGLVMWLVQPIPGTKYCIADKCVEEVPEEAPREVTIGSGALMQGIEEAALGMRAGISRLLVVGPDKTRVVSGRGNVDVGLGDTVVVFLTCVSCCAVHQAMPFTTRCPEQKNPSIRDWPHPRHASEGRGGLTARDGSGPRALPWSETSASGTCEPLQTGLPASTDANDWLQGALHQAREGAAGGGTSRCNWHTDVVERSLSRVETQLAVLSDRIDRLGLDEQLEKNNSTIERIVRRAVGTAPLGEVAAEDSSRDRDALLATVERYKSMYAEAVENYQRALEAMNRHTERVRGLENDLHLQRELYETRLRDAESQRQLQIIELTTVHKEALLKVGMEKYEEGVAVGRCEGHLQGRRESVETSEGYSESEWKQQMMSKDQETLSWESKYMESKSRHLQQVQLLQEELHALRRLTEMKHVSVDDGITGVTCEADDVAIQCKRVKRVLNGLYDTVETQLATLGRDEIAFQKVLSILVAAVRSVCKAHIVQIKNEALQRHQKGSQMKGNQLPVARRFSSPDQCLQPRLPDQLARMSLSPASEPHTDDGPSDAILHESCEKPQGHGVDDSVSLQPPPVPLLQWMDADCSPQCNAVNRQSQQLLPGSSDKPSACQSSEDEIAYHACESEVTDHLPGRTPRIALWAGDSLPNFGPLEAERARCLAPQDVFPSTTSPRLIAKRLSSPETMPLCERSESSGDRSVTSTNVMEPLSQ